MAECLPLCTSVFLYVRDPFVKKMRMLEECEVFVSVVVGVCGVRMCDSEGGCGMWGSVV